MAVLKSSCPAPTRREIIWAAIRELKEFTQFNLGLKTGLSGQKGHMQDYLRGLEAAGIIQAIFRERAKRTIYRLVQDCGVNAPRVTRGGAILPPSGRARMWKAMRILRTFTARELAGAASLPDVPVAVSDAEFYCAWLCRGGYLRKSGTAWTFVPAMDSGPKAPQVLRIHQLYDPNTAKIMYTGEPEGRDDE